MFKNCPSFNCPYEYCQNEPQSPVHGYFLPAVSGVNLHVSNVNVKITRFGKKIRPTCNKCLFNVLLSHKAVYGLSLCDSAIYENNLANYIVTEAVITII